MGSPTTSLRHCTSCNRKLNINTQGDDFVSLRPCKCIVCPKCCLQLVINRKFGTPSCTKHPNSDLTSIYYLEGSRSAANIVQEIKIEKHKPTQDKDPCRYFESLFDNKTVDDKAKEKPKNGNSTSDSADDAQQKLLLSLSYAQKQGLDATPASISVAMDREYGPETEQDELKLRLIFGLLHEPIIRSHALLWKEMSFPRMTPSEFCSHMMHEDESLLLKLLYSLATGEMKVPMKDIATDKAAFSRFMACGIAKEMIMRLEMNRPGPFQWMMGDLLGMVNAPKATKDFMSKIRVAVHRSTVDRESTRSALVLAAKKINLDPLDAFSLHFDNIGFKGRKKKWSQHTVLQICVITYNQLKEAGFYKQGGVSRKRKEFQELVENTKDEVGEQDESSVARSVAQRVVGIRKADWEKLTHRVLTTIKTAITIELPGYEACKEYLAVGERFCETRIPMNLGIQIETPPKQQDKLGGRVVAQIPVNNSIPGSRLGEEEDDSKEDGLVAASRPTFYEVNNMTLDNVLHEDPNATSTVAKIAEYLERASKFPAAYDRVKSGGERPVRDFIAPATCDGAPSKRWLDLRAKDISEKGYEQRTHKRAVFFSGGFHFLMEFMTMRGRLSRGIFSFFGSLWRPTQPQLNWILSISDPKEYLQEMPQYLLAHYRGAYDMMPKRNQRGVVEVHEHMLERAIEIPTCMAILLDLRLIELSFMIRDSEKSGPAGDVEMFLSTMRFSLVLFTVTHAINYAHIVCDFLEWWELSSDADKIFFQRWLFTKRSPFGKPIWVDKGVEWTVRHIRMFLGRKAKTNQDAKMEQVIPDIPFRIKAKTDLAGLLGFESADDYTSLDWNSQTMKLSSVYFETTRAIHETNVWGEGGLEGALKSESQSHFLHAEQGDSMPMSNSFLSAFEFGQERALRYYMEHDIFNRGEVKRSEENVSLKLLPTAAGARNTDLEKLKAVRLSVDPKQLQPLQRDFPKEKIVKELDELRECVYPEIPEHTIKTSREALVNCLCEFRKRYFQDFPVVFQEAEASVEALELEDTFTTPESRQEQIKSKIFSLDEDAIHMFQSS